MSLPISYQRLVTGVGATALAFVLASCGSGEESAPAGADSEAAASPAPTDPVDSAAVDDDTRFGLDLETTGETIVETFTEADGFTVDDTTLTVTFTEGEAAFDGSIDCLSVAGLMKQGETLVLSYPDGPVTC